MNIYKKAIDHYGKEKQINQAIEELNELAVSLNHIRRDKCDKSDLLGEIADVLIMIEQVRHIFDIPLADVKKAMDRREKFLSLKIDVEEFEAKTKSDDLYSVVLSHMKEMDKPKFWLKDNDD